MGDGKLLGIEIGGTKTQLGVGTGRTGGLEELLRYDVDAAAGAEGILSDIERGVRELATRHRIRRVGVGFGGPVDAASGRTITSHQIRGWDDVDLAKRIESVAGAPVALANDCDAAALAEATLGAGAGRRVVFYVTVGTGVGGGLVIDGKIHDGFGRGAAEIGHLRPGLSAVTPEATVEAAASGRGLAAAARSLLRDRSDASAADLLRRCGDEPERLTGKAVGEAATAGNPIACEALARGVTTLGWAIAQMITLIAPDVVIVGGGVSLLGEELFLAPLRRSVDQYLFPPFLGRVEVLPAKLGEEVVLHGTIALAVGA